MIHLSHEVIGPEIAYLLELNLHLAYARTNRDHGHYTEP